MSTTTRFTLEQYHAMADAGLLRPDSKDYLWRGEILEAMGQNPPHQSTTDSLADALQEIDPKRDWTTRIEQSLPLPDDSEPMPDLVVLRGHYSAFFGRCPRLDEVELLVEVAHTSLRFDLGDKLAGYAEAGIPHYWVADVANCLLHTFADPDVAAGVYRASRVFAPGESAEAPNGGRVAVSDVFAHAP